MVGARRFSPIPALVGLACLCGCGLELPERPSFATTLYVPLQPLQISAAELTSGAAEVESARAGELPVDAERGESDRRTLTRAWSHGQPFTVVIDNDVREQLERGLERVVIQAEIENAFPTRAALKLRFAGSEEAVFASGALTFGGETVEAALVNPQCNCIEQPVRLAVPLEHCGGDLAVLAEDELHGGLEVILVNDNGRDIDVWSTDYLTVRGVIAFECRLE